MLENIITGDFGKEMLKDLENQKYILLETLRKNNRPVKTPVWFVIKNNLIYVITREQTGKIKRLKNNKKVRLAPCSFRGKPNGDWLAGIASFVSEQEANHAIYLRKKKYGFMAKIAQFASKSKGDLIVFSIKLQNDLESGQDS